VAGLTYWVTQLDQGKLAIGNIADAINKGAQGTDATIIANKTTAATEFTKALDTTAEIVAYAGVNSTGLAAVKAWLNAVTSDATTLTNATSATTLTSITTTVLNNVASTGSTFTLTNGTDIATANVFNAARGWTPGGTDQVNTLDDDDVLTGTGTNPTLNFTYIDDVDVFGGVLNVVTPTLNGIETVNVSVQGTQAKTLDLQDTTGIDAINVTRVNQANFTAQNIAEATANLSINNSQAVGRTITFDYLRSALAGTADATTLTLNNVNVASVVV
jgi:hypothetical protein